MTQPRASNPTDARWQAARRLQKTAADLLDPSLYQNALDLYLQIQASSSPSLTDPANAKLSYCIAECYAGLATIELASGLGYDGLSPKLRAKLERFLATIDRG